MDRYEVDNMLFDKYEIKVSTFNWQILISEFYQFYAEVKVMSLNCNN